MTRHQLKYLPIDEMKVSKLNMRYGRKPPNVDDIYPSVLKSGVLETMLVRREGDHWGVVAGRRRLFALRKKQDETGKPQTGPCAIMSEGDDAAAMEASLIENIGHEPATEMQQYEAFGKLAKEGRSVAGIADYFGVDEKQVKRILALAGLIPGIRKLYAAEEIDGATVRALTLGTKAQQEEWLRLFKSDDETAPYGRQCRAWIAGGAAITADKALFDILDYEGEIIGDLFGEFGVFASADQFWEAQSREIAARVEAFREKGWRDVNVMERGKMFHSWDHEKRSRTKGGRVFIEIRHDGSVAFHEGYVTGAEGRQLAKKKTGKAGEGKAQSVRPEMSGPMSDYVNLHRHAAARAELIGKPGVALRLMIAHAIAGSALWTVRAHQVRTAKEATRESVETGPASSQFEETRVAVAGLFTSHGARFEGVANNSDDWRLCEIFAALLKMTDEELFAVAAVVMGETLDAGSAAVEAALHAVGGDLARWWTPDAAFFELLKDKRAVNEMVKEVAGATAASSVLADTAKAQKAVIRERLAKRDQGAAPWLPGWLQRPPRRFVEGAACPPADQWARIVALFGEDELEAALEDAA
ncbi:MAG TPA: ParB/RepB/Spo0J family partition protein [Amphiplicatus sp.]|nr:ParB/RepB/Spo0J family partition protein [Amphiplicatus sp.]MCB9956144.1 ParB/RepB/Spo0J family partition protein [Caulobacterales bacterium]HOP18451.1 ParB/RepB/Spo0J family partition protein [Amphiplicatus sp.]HRX40407.1 ParB/RepB/Spo0J family partition protein [Parvularculaceae bacterium]